MKRLLALALILILCPVLGLAATYVFPQEGFRYTQADGEVVLTNANLESYAEFLSGLGTTKEAVQANYAASGIAMEIVPAQGAQIAVSVIPDAGTDTASMNEADREAFLARFAGTGLYEEVSWAQDVPYVRLTSSAMFASMPVWQLRYLGRSHEMLYTLTLTAVGRALTEADDAGLAGVISRMRFFAPVEKLETTPVPATTLSPAATPVPAEDAQIVTEGEISLEAVPARVTQGEIALRGQAKSGGTVRVLEGQTLLSQSACDTEGRFLVRLQLPLGAHALSLETEEARASLDIEVVRPVAEITMSAAMESVFTGENVSVDGTTVPEATVYVTGERVNTNVKAARSGAFHVRIPISQPGSVTLTLRSHAQGYEDGTAEVTVTRVLTEREQLAQFKLQMLTPTYAELLSAPERYQGEKFIFRGRIMEYADYNGEPCALVCVSNPNTGIWRDPLYAVVSPEEAPAVGDIMTFYLIGEGITLPAAGTYTASGAEEEVPVARTFYLTTNR